MYIPCNDTLRNGKVCYTKYELGSLESKLIFTLEEQNITHFTVNDAKRILDTTN